ncbi:MAG: hypothetical protein WKG07_02125 [Hymenobacter sp.]
MRQVAISSNAVLHRAVPDPTLISSKALPWRGARAEQFYLPSAALPAVQTANHVLVLTQAAQPLVVRRRVDGRRSETTYQVEDLALCVGGEHETQLEWATPSHNIYLTLDHQYLARLASQQAELSQFSLREQLKFTDPYLPNSAGSCC